MDVGDQLHAPAALSPRKCFRYPLCGRVTGASSWPGSIMAKRKVSYLSRKLVSDSLVVQPIPWWPCKRRCGNKRLWITYVIICERSWNTRWNPESGFCPGSLLNTEGSEFEGVGPFCRYVGCHVGGVWIRVCEQETFCLWYSYAVDSSGSAQFGHDLMFRIHCMLCCVSRMRRVGTIPQKWVQHWVSTTELNYSALMKCKSLLNSHYRVAF
jgi:hypothetical protein